MKRFVGYVSMCASLLTAVLVGVAPTILGISGNSDFSTSRNFVFKVSKRITTNDFSSGTEQDAVQNSDKTPLEEVKDVFKTRLDLAEISEYKLETIGDDTLSLTFKDNLQDYVDVVDYLTFSNSMLAKNYEETFTIGKTAKEYEADSQSVEPLFKEHTARVEYKDGYPYVVVQLQQPETFKEKVESISKENGDDSSTDNGAESGTPAIANSFAWANEANTLAEGEEGTEEETPNSGTEEPEQPLPPVDNGDANSNGDGSTEEVKKIDPKKVLFILNDWLSGFDLSDILSNTVPNINKDNFKDYVVTYFDTTNPASFFWEYDSSLSEEDQKAKVYNEVYFQFYDLGAVNGGETPIDVTTEYQFYNTKTTDERLAYKKANLFANRLNSDNLKFAITLINESSVNANTNIVPPFVEYIQQAGNINFGSTVLIATAIALIICTLFLLLNYGLSGLMASITTLGNVVTALGIFNILGNEFNIGTILGLFAVMLISTFLSCSWLSKSKNEIYAGKALKKAYQEADKKYFSNLLDFSIVGAVVGLTTYLMPNAVLTSFGVVTLLGSGISLISSLVLFRGANWFLYNSNFAQQHLKLFGVDKKVTADVTKDVKSTYLESFKRKTPKNKFKISGIVGAILVLASIVSITTFQCINGNIYNAGTNEINTKVVVTYNIKNSTNNYDFNNTSVSIKKAIEDLSTDAELKAKPFKNKTDIEYYSYDYTYGTSVNNLITNKEVYFVVDLGNIFDVKDSTAKYYSPNTIVDGKALTLEEAINQAVQIDAGLDSNYLVNVVKSFDATDDYINYYVLIATLISVAALALYFLLRFGVSRFLSGTLIAGGLLVSLAGLFSLIRGPFPSEITLGLLLIAILTYIVLSIGYSSEKQYYKENKRKLADLSERECQFDYIHNLNYTMILTTTANVAFMVMSFYFSTVFSVYTLALILLGMILVCIFVKSLSLPLEMSLTRFFAKAKEKSESHKGNKTKDKKHKSIDDGPEEAIFIGIND